MDSIANLPLNNDPGAIIAFLGEPFGLEYLKTKKCYRVQHSDQTMFRHSYFEQNARFERNVLP